MKLPFQQVDAFADRPFTGNPAAVMPLEAWLDDATLQAIAAENNLAETAFIVPWLGDDADFELRWFTPEVEVALCGHATLATGHALLSSRETVDRVRFATRKAGILEVARDGDGYRLALPAWEVAPKPLPDHAAALGGTPMESHWRDGGYAFFLYGSAAEVRDLSPDFRAMRSFGDILFMATAPGDETDIVSRVFAPGVGIDEDPVTGSAHCLLTTFWAKRLGRERFSAYQASARGGYLSCALEGDRVVLGGKCVTVIEGVFSLA
ncbi:PhzF family phenazine biosynthesis protein [Rhizorhabdus argentea]|uniref:PhzF family phenazine biosynthesis protein n=1 Tax=Rhizorhabdus argentea TaxID=1387174 RepID=UPI0030ECB650